MKANELRIGNWVQCDDGKSIVCGIEQDETFLNNGVQYRNDAIEPIPLTEEWLLKFGFEKVIYDSDETGYGTEYELKANNDVFINYSDDFSCAIYDSKSAMKDSVGVLPTWNQCKYVHGLQNLYFALTGEELTIKEL